MDFDLTVNTSLAWLDTVLADFDSFLLDHASCEKKASGMAMSMISHYPDKPLLIKEMLNLAMEELSHFREVVRIILDKGLQPAADKKDDYIRGLHGLMTQDKEAYLLDRLLIASIVEARGAERFGLIAQAITDPELQRFYQAITDSESRHYQLFLSLAHEYFPEQQIQPRLDYLLKEEGKIITTLRLQSRLH